jgi:hypothetical protein
MKMQSDWTEASNPRHAVKVSVVAGEMRQAVCLHDRNQKRVAPYIGSLP